MGKKSKDSLGDRMKQYEDISRIYLTRRMPLIIRIDGKAFHTYTRGFDRPFDHVLQGAMHSTARYLAKFIEGCKLAYTQSDEISLLLTDYDSIETQPWFGKNLQKLVSISASMATMAFNRAFTNMVIDNEFDHSSVCDAHERSAGFAMFDARAFVLPKEEVCNYFIWRQQDAIRNSIQMVGQKYFSSNELHKKNQTEIQQMLMEKHGVDWSAYPASDRFGVCITRESYDVDGVERHKWIIDKSIPCFWKDRKYIDSAVYPSAE